ncbi:tubulin polyglutamylase TTLL5 isoform X2 [Triplophysa rosa]|uniref:tubulin polyglutamylase TTLL5 isoform X2 n=1 Tax=Triplophysa rosa TaxID=992332 RepID=UPI0025463523|nr:tubulin polyglutamylase TTLL5 isoform X2 [Triplophysa rosa]
MSWMWWCCDRSHPCIGWSGVSRRIPVLLFCAEAIVTKDVNICSVGEEYKMAFKIVRTESRLVRGLLVNHGFHEVHPNSTDFNLMWTGSHLKPHLLHSLQDFQRVNHFPRSYELTRKDRLYKNIQRMQQTHGFHNFHIVPQTFLLPAEHQDFSSSFSKDKGPWIIKPVASSRGRGIYLISSLSQIALDENVLVSRYISNPLLIDDFNFDVRLYVLVTSYDPLIVYLYEEGLARFATVKYDHATANIKNQFMHLTNYSVNKKSRDYVSCDDPEVEDYGNKWSMSAMLRYLRQEGRDTTLLMGQIEDLIIKAVLSAEIHIATACKMFVPHRWNCFELYGFDVLVDSNLRPWLLEVNLSPSLACDAPLDLKIKASMISDMFSLVGFVCHDPSSRQSRADRSGLDSRVRNSIQKLQRQRLPSVHRPEAQRDKQMDSTVGLTAEEVKVVRRVQEEYERRGGFVRIFPTADTWELYSDYLEYKTSMNAMLAKKLFHGRSGQTAASSKSRIRVNDNVAVAAFYTHHLVQYERKLLTLEARKQKHKPGRAPNKRREEDAKLSSAHVSENEEGVERKAEPNSSHLHTADELHTRNAPLKPQINLLHIVQQGWSLSKVQARMVFSCYLQRVQLRLLTESTQHRGSAWTRKDHDQMELVVRFLKRASSNLQQDVCMMDTGHHLSLPDRQRLLSHQLGNFIQLYHQETKEMVKRLEKISDEDHCISSSVLQEFILEASEGDLEEVLTFYSQKNKSASVFLGSGKTERKPDVRQATHSVTHGQGFTHQSHEALVGDASAGSENPDTIIQTQNTDVSRDTKHSNPNKSHTIQRERSRNRDDTSNRTQVTDSCCSVRRNRSTEEQNPSHTAALECEHIVLQHSRPPPYIRPPPHPLDHTSSFSGTPPTITWASACSGSTDPTTSRPQESTCVNASVCSRRFSRPSSAGQVMEKMNVSKLRPVSARVGKEKESLSAQAQSNQQDIVSALRKLLEKQAARQYSSSNHISLLTQHLTSLNLTGGLFSRAGSGVPVRGTHLDATAERSNIRTACEIDCVCDGDAVSAQSVEQKQRAATGNYQLQFAIHQLQQQKLRSRQLLNQIRTRQQAVLTAHTLVPAPSDPSHAPVSPPDAPRVDPTIRRRQSPAMPVLAPKPPSGPPRDARACRTAHCLHKRTSADPPAFSGHHVVYDSVCAKTGLSMYSKVFHTQGSNNR